VIGLIFYKNIDFYMGALYHVRRNDGSGVDREREREREGEISCRAEQ
jgi:hypothetical protein